MEIIIPDTFKLDKAIDRAWNQYQENQNRLSERRKVAEKNAQIVFLEQFKADLLEVIPENYQSSLGFSIATSEDDIQDIDARFSYLEVAFCLRRVWINSLMFWELSWSLTIDEQSITCLPETLFQQMLVELGKIKQAVTSTNQPI
jgi:hypothetical protein